MNLRQMRVFKETSEDLHFTKTAQKLHMTQPAVSHVIREMEEELNVRLFERIGKKVYLTDAGATLLHKINQLLELYDHLGQRITDTQIKYPFESEPPLPSVISGFCRGYMRGAKDIPLHH